MQPPADRLPRSDVNILLVDDDPANLLALEAVLAEPGRKLVRAATGEDALRRVLAEDFAVVLLDLQLPGIDGFETARLVRSRPRSRHTPIIFLTGQDPSAFPVEEAYALGAVDYLVKPVVPAVLRAKVAVFVALRAAADALRAEVAERKRAEEHARAAVRELERSNAELEKFAYVASHDLQEPLRKIQAFGDRLRDQFRDPLGDRGRDYIDRMLVSADRMGRLIEDLLAFSRVTTRARPFGPVDLAETARQVVSDLEEQAQRTGGRIEVGELPAVHADPTQMRQLLQNLIGNGLKFHRPDVPPVVRVVGRVVGGADGQACELTVSDNGIGFDEKYRERIFEVFQRLHGRDEYEGTGIGLAICKRIVERHGGTIVGHSKPGDGSAFVVTLPVRPAAVVGLSGEAGA